MNNRLNPLQLKKSHSLVPRKEHHSKDLDEQITQQNNPQQSNIEELIKLKYNFTFRVKSFNPFNKPIKKLQKMNLQNNQLNNSGQFQNHSLKINLLTEIQKQQNNKFSLFQNDHIKLQQNQHQKCIQKLKTKLSERQRNEENSAFLKNYQFVKPPQKRNINEYKNCIKKIELNTTYRGFNTNKNGITELKSPDDLFYSAQKSKNEKVNMMSPSYDNNNIKERKRIVSYMIERGFARKMQETLMRIRKQKKQIHDQTLSVKNSMVMSPIITKQKRSVVLTLSPYSVKNENQSPIKEMQKKQHPIDPW